MLLKKLVRRGRNAPAELDVSSALSRLLEDAGTTPSTLPVDVASVTGARRPVYHLSLPPSYTQAAGVLLSDVLHRPFSTQHSGWLIDVREARTLIEAAHRVVIAGKR